MTEITKDVLIAKRNEYVGKLQTYQNTVIAIQGAIEAIDDLLQDVNEDENERINPTA
jgi:hypothetical protein